MKKIKGFKKLTSYKIGDIIKTPDGLMEVIKVYPNYEKTKLQKAWEELFMILCKEFRVDKVVEWLNNKLKRRDNSDLR